MPTSNLVELPIADTNEFHPLVDGAAYARWSPIIIMRATYSTGHVDHAYATSRVQAKRIASVGHYGYVTASADAAAQGVFFAQTVNRYGGLGPTDFLSWDLEEGPGNQAGRAAAWLAAVHPILGERMTQDWGYSGEFFWSAHLGTVTGVHRWVAGYGQKNPPPGADLWQFTDAQQVPGVLGRCDCSVFYGTAAQFLALIGKPPAKPPTGGKLVNVTHPPVAVCAVPGGALDDYWIACSDGGVITFGKAPFFGSAAAAGLAAPIVSMAATPGGEGYWLVGADGGVFTFGDAGFYGSTGGVTLTKPIISMTVAPDGKGYWLLGGDGGLFAYGSAVFNGRVVVAA